MLQQLLMPTLIAEQSSPTLLAVAVPGFGARAVLAARVGNALVTVRALPTHEASENTHQHRVTGVVLVHSNQLYHHYSVYVCMYQRVLLVCMYVCMYVVYMYIVYTCMLVCMFVCMHVCMYACMSAYIRVCMYACMFVCMHVCLYVYLYVCMRLHVLLYSQGHRIQSRLLNIICTTIT